MTAGKRLASLDGIRGLAAMVVIIGHTMLIPQPMLVSGPCVMRTALIASSGVLVFFSLSAYSLMYTASEWTRSPQPLLNFFVRRASRIAPLFYFMLVVSLIRDRWLFGSSHSLGEIAASVTFVYNLIPDWKSGIVWASWTIGIEVLFYLVFPFLHRWITSVWRALGLYVLLLVLNLAVFTAAKHPALGRWLTPLTHDYSILVYFPSFALGIGLFLAYRHIEARQLSQTARRIIGFAAILFAVVPYGYVIDGLDPRFPGGDIRFPLAALFMFGVIVHPTPLVVNRATAYIGRIAYSTYLVHATVIYLLRDDLRRIIEVSPHFLVGAAIDVGLVFAIVIPLAELTYRYIELPGLALGRRMVIKLSSRTADRVAVAGSALK